MTVYVTVTDTAKLVRAELRRAFPGVRFSVRSDRYAGGASIDVRWTDGPTERMVREIVGRFQGSRFDSQRTTSETVYDIEPDPVEGLRVLRYCADHVGCTRQVSAEHVDRVLPMVRPIRSAHGWGDPYCRGCGRRKDELGWFVPDADRLATGTAVGCSEECAAKVAAHFIDGQS